MTTHDFNGMSLRVVMFDDRPWFVASDVCDALDLQGYPSSHLKKLNGDEKLALSRAAIPRLSGLSALFGPMVPSVSIISESGLYKLITRSDKPAAKPFQEWVTRDVLPAIRRYGTYSVFDGDFPQT